MLLLLLLRCRETNIEVSVSAPAGRRALNSTARAPV